MNRSSMRALVLEDNGKLIDTAIKFPEPYAGNSVLIRVAAAGVCGSDLPRAFDNGAYHYPLVLGHEFSGTVDIADDAGRYSIGDRVVAFPLIPCRKCPSCAMGAYAQCGDYDYLGSRRDGSFAEYVWVPAENLVAIPPHLDTIHAALTEPAAVALHCVRRLHVQPGGRAAVFGGGPIGIFAALWLRVAGCSKVFVVDIDSEKLAIAGKYGFIAIDATEGDPVKAIQTESDEPLRIDYAVEACGLALTYRQALSVVDTFGQVALMGNIKEPLTLSPVEVSSILRREITVVGTWNSSIVPTGTDEWSTALSYIERVFDVTPLISHRVGLSDAADFLEQMYRREVSHMRVMIVPGMSL